MVERLSGILLHPTSLPGPDGIGDLGPEAYRWLDFLKQSGTQYWQILPLGPTGYGDSPYQCFSAFAGNPYLISPTLLLEEGLLDFKDLENRPNFPSEKVDFGPAIIWKSYLLDQAFLHFIESENIELQKELDTFMHYNQDWLEDFSLFMAIKENQGGNPWSLWPEPLKFREDSALDEARRLLSTSIKKHQFSQFLFFKQWNQLHSYAKSRGIQIIGDMPFVIAFDSSDVWSNPELFLMDKNLNPTMVAGVPPDYFSATGQLWGNPLYKWDHHINSNFSWWLDRLSIVLQTVDLVRLDHFRGFSAAWHVPYGNVTAIEGSWIKGPAIALFKAFKEKFPDLPIIAEDLGVITEDVKSLRDQFNLPGMKILQFSFTGDPDDDFLPHNYPVNCVAYTGSHDNDTAVGWFDHAKPREKDFCLRYLNTGEIDINWAMIRSIWQSVARIVVAPMQDLLGLGSETRMNMPGSESGNWSWRIKPDQVNQNLTARLWELNFLYARLPLSQKNSYIEELEQELGDTVKPH